LTRIHNNKGEPKYWTKTWWRLLPHFGPRLRFPIVKVGAGKRFSLEVGGEHHDSNPFPIYVDGDIPGSLVLLDNYIPAVVDLGDTDETLQFGPRKKARMGANKVERLSSLTEELNVIATRIQLAMSSVGNVLTDTLTSINGTQSLQTVMESANKPMLKEIHKIIGDSNNIDSRHTEMSKILFSQTWQTINRMQTQLDYAKEALSTASELSCTTSFSGDDGKIMWKEIQSKCLDLVGGEI